MAHTESSMDSTVFNEAGDTEAHAYGGTHSKQGVGTMKTPIEFLRWLRPDGPWVITAIIPDGKIATRNFTDLDAAGKWITTRNKTANVYYNVNPLRADYKANKKAAKADVAALAFLHVDVDPAPGKPIEAERARIRGIIDGIEPAPSCIIDSGGGYNLLWRLSQPVPADGDWAPLEAYNVHLENLYAADKCHNIDRILRLPFTTNWPNAVKVARGRVKSESSIVAISDEKHRLDVFSSPKDAATAPSKGADGVGHPDFDLSTLPDDLLELIRVGDASP